MQEKGKNAAAAGFTAALHSRAPYIILCLLVILNISNIFRLETYPFTDLPNHMAEAELFKDSIGECRLCDIYRSRINVVSPNIIHALFCSVFPDSESGTRVFYAIYIMLLPLSVALLIHRLGGNPWFSLLSIALLYNDSAMWGFTGFTMAIPITILAFSTAQRYISRPDPRQGVLLSLYILLLFYTHALAFLFSIVILAAVVFTYP